jgi:protein TonB
VQSPVEPATSNAVMVSEPATVSQPAVQPNGRPLPIRIGGDLQQASLLSHPNPEYPLEARSKGVQGVVTVAGILAKDGSLQELKIIGSSNPLLEKSVLETIHTWAFKPTLLNNTPVETMVTVVLNFKLSL